MLSPRSKLNPLASTFIPSSVTGVASETEALNSDSEVFNTKSISLLTIAANFVQKVIKYKEERGELSLTKVEVLNIVIRLIICHYGIKSKRELMRVIAFFWDRIPSEVSIKGNEESFNSCKINTRRFDFSAYRIPAPTILLVAFCGLYRHEQAFRPLLSLAQRPTVLKDEVWSLTDNDLKLWNRSVVQKCSCPPMFGYHIPDDFFGNPFKFSNPCSEKLIHLCRSEESSKGNEFILLERARNDQIAESEFVDFEERLYMDPKSDLDYYSKQMKDIVYSVYSMIDEYDPDENVTKSLIEDVTDEDCASNFMETLWDTNDSELNTPSSYKLDDDDDHHPLLDVKFEEPIEGISMEVKELLRKSFSNEWDTDIASSSCDPPCSVWCSKLERSNSVKNGKKSDSSAIDLLNETTKFMTDISSGPETLFPKPTFKRSFSANDGVYRDTQVSLQTLLKLDPINFTTFNRRASNDSGIVLSQDEDVPCEDESDEVSSDKAPMWTLFSGEHSLWKPLPVSEQSKSSHKRARDLKRQTSSSVN